METNIAKRNIESTFTAEKQAFKIEASAKAFQILSSNLYTDKPLAIVRELSANALDAHKQAKEERPFTISLPNRMNPSFEIRDYGIGMSPETITSLYTTFFGSDKNHNNDAIGGLGLGSKTPFSYTDTFTLLSFWEGIKYTWLCMIQENGQPSISMVEQAESKEDRGIQYIIPVKAEDFHTFSAKTRTVLQYFPQGSYEANDIEVQEVQYVLKETEYGFRTGSSSWPRVIMGPIAYRLDRNALDEVIQRRYRKLLENSHLDIFCEIGDIDIQASREALSYDKKSQKQIETVLERVQGVMTQDITNKIKDCPTYLEACVKGAELSQQADVKFSGLTWRGTQLERKFEIDRFDGCCIVSGRGNLTASDALSFAFSKYGSISLEHARNAIVVYYDPLVQFNKIRLKTKILQDREQHYIVFNNEQDLFAFQAKTQRMDNVTTADFPLPEKEDATYKSVSRSKVKLKMRGPYGGWESTDTTIEDINQIEKACWAPLSGGGNEPWVDTKDQKAFILLGRIWDEFKVVGIPKSLARKTKHITLPSIQVLARAAFIEHINTEERFDAAFTCRSQLKWMEEFITAVDQTRWKDLPVVKRAALWQETITVKHLQRQLEELFEWKFEPMSDKDIKLHDATLAEQYKLMSVLNCIYSYSANITQTEYTEQILQLLHRKKEDGTRNKQPVRNDNNE